MRIKEIQNLGSFCLIAAFGIFGLTACNSDGDTKTADKMSSDSSVKTAGATDSTMKDTTGVAVTSPKKKRKASIVMPAAGTDKMVKDKDGIYNRAEVMPEYPGGQNALSAYINDQFSNDQTVVDDNTTSAVKVSFVVDEHGKVMDAQLMGDTKSGNSMGNEAIKAISNMPTWTPGKVKGKNVKTRLELPITFES